MAKKTEHLDEKKQPSFEEMLTELEELNVKLESGDLSLEKAMEVYERGIKLTALCNSCLKNAKLKIEELKQTQNDG